MPSFTPSQAEVLGLFIVNIFWGIHIVSFGYSLSYQLLSVAGWRPFNQINRVLLATTFLMAAAGTATIILNGLRAIDSLAPTKITTQFENVSSRISMLKAALHHVQFILADTILTHNCWLIRKKLGSSLILFALWLGASSTTVWDLCVLSKLHTNDDPHVQLRYSATAFWVISLGLKLFITGSIIWQLRAAESNASPIRQLIRLVVESGFLYTCAAVLSCGIYLGRNISIYFVPSIEVQVAAIAVNLITIRLHSTLRFDDIDSDKVSTGIVFHEVTTESVAPRTQL